MAAIWSMSQDHRPPGSLEAPNIGDGNVMRPTTWNAHRPENACLGLMLMDKRLAFRWCAICHRTGTADARARYSLCSYLCILLFEIDVAASILDFSCSWHETRFITPSRKDETWAGTFFCKRRRRCGYKIFFRKSFKIEVFNKFNILHNWKINCSIKVQFRY